MTDVAVLRSQGCKGAEAGELLGNSFRERFKGESPDAVIVFASPACEPKPLLEGIEEICAPVAMIGCTSAGEFTSEGTSSSSVVAFGIRSESFRFSVHLVQDIKSGVPQAAKSFASSFVPDDDPEFPHRTLLLLMDVLAGYGEEFLHHFTEATDGKYQVFGGGAADDAAFKETFVFAGSEVYSDAAVGLEFRTTKPVGIGVSHGWTPFSQAMEVSSAEGLRLLELDGRPAVQVIEDFARERDIVFDREAPLGFFLNHVLGIEADEGFKLRVPLAIGDDDALVCAAEVPMGAQVRIMRTRDTSAVEAARTATQRAWMQLKNKKITPRAAIFFDCAATRLRMGENFGASVAEVAAGFGACECAGCNTYGQFARVEGQFSGFHNCTAVVCALPE